MAPTIWKDHVLYHIFYRFSWKKILYILICFCYLWKIFCPCLWHASQMRSPHRPLSISNMTVVIVTLYLEAGGRGCPGADTSWYHLIIPTEIHICNEHNNMGWGLLMLHSLISQLEGIIFLQILSVSNMGFIMVYKCFHKLCVLSAESYLYLTGVTAAVLQWHQSNINVICYKWTIFW